MDDEKVVKGDFTQEADHKKVMEQFGRLADLAEDMYLALKDIAGGSYNEEKMIAIAQELINKVEGK